MWKLTFLLLAFFFTSKEEFSVLIVDDCKEWKKVEHYFKASNDKKMFSYEKDLVSIPFISLNNIWLEDEDAPRVKNLTLMDIQNSNPSFTSGFTEQNWIEYVDNQKGKKIYLVTPEEYCSDKRFSFKAIFTLYEINILIPVKE